MDGQTKSQVYDSAMEALRLRKSWEVRQATLAKMRRTGLPRANKPFPNAADMHYPLADTVIEKQKPYLYDQIFAPNKLASFTSWRKDREEKAATAAEWFDYKLRYCSNLRKRALILIDQMCELGKSYLKVRWDKDQKQLAFDTIDPVYLIVPQGTKEISRAPWCVHVQHFQKDDFLNDPRWMGKVSEETIAQYTGHLDEDGNPGKHKEDELYRRAGITHSNKGRVIVWECWKRTGDKWTIEYVCPAKPKDVLHRQGHPYKHGLLPIVEFPLEIIEEDFYSPRGMVFRLAPFQSAITKSWNEKIDAMTYYNRPMYTTDRPSGSTGKFRALPGQIVDGGLRRVEHGQPPISYDVEMNQTRLVAESMIGSPDYLSGQPINTSDRRTKFELQQVISQGDGVSSLRGKTLSIALKELYEQAYKLLCEFDKAGPYFYHKEIKEMDKEAFHAEYLIVPNGSFEMANQEFKAAVAGILFETLKGNAYTDQAELTQFFQEAIAPQQAKRLFRRADSRAASESEHQAMELGPLLMGYPVQVEPSDMHRAHIEVLWGWIEKAMAQQSQPGLESMVRILTHLQGHMTALKEENKDDHDEIEAQIGPGIKELSAQVNEALQAQAQGQHQQQPQEAV